MNIFVLSQCPTQATAYMCDQHIVKMALETAQMLSTVAVSRLPECSSVVYKPCHKHHPCTIWAGKSKRNYEWLVNHGMSISREFTYRYGKKHASEKIIATCKELMLDLDLPETELTPFAQAMPDKYKDQDAVVAYRSYYIGEKLSWARWTKTRPMPLWINDRSTDLVSIS